MTDITLTEQAILVPVEDDESIIASVPWSDPQVLINMMKSLPYGADVLAQMKSLLYGTELMSTVNEGEDVALYTYDQPINNLSVKYIVVQTCSCQLILSLVMFATCVVCFLRRPSVEPVVVEAQTVEEDKTDKV